MRRLILAAAAPLLLAQGAHYEGSVYIAPVTVEDRAYTAAGSTVTDDVPEGALAIARQRQTNIRGWADRLRKTWKK